MVVLPIAIIPIILIAAYSTTSIYKRMFLQSRSFYSDIITQVASNIDFYYNQYAISFIDISHSSAFQEAINRPDGVSIFDRNFMINDVLADEALRSIVQGKTQGEFLFIELDRADLINHESFTVNKVTPSSASMIDVKQLIQNPVFKKMQENKNMKPIMVQDKSVSGYFMEKRVLFFCPYLPKGEAEINNVMLIIETLNFMEDLYDKNINLKFGTIYILDQFNNIMNSNHPSVDDYYAFDNEKGEYILEDGDVLNDPYEGMSFAEYRLLNTDRDIFQLDSVKSQLLELEEWDDEPISKIVTHKGVKYLSIMTKANNSNLRITYFHPLKQVYAPIQRIVIIIAVIALIVLLIVFILSFVFSNYFTRPIVELTLANRILKSGNYEYRISSQEFFGEFIELGESFNNMANKIHDYSENMEELVARQNKDLHDKIRELNEKNMQTERELQMAQKIQNSLVPKVFPTTNLLDFSAKYIPMDAIGGDLYDVYQLSERKFAVMILDVCGHGVPAALITTMAKISFSSNAKKESSPKAVMSLVNDELSDAIGGGGDYFTAFYAVIDIETKKISYCNAGHNEMLLIHRDGGFEKMVTNSPVVGVFKNVTFQTVDLSLKEHDRILLYTDGVIEARDESSTLYEDERLFNIISKSSGITVSDFIESIYTDLLIFKGDAPNSDDIALLAIDYL